MKKIVKTALGVSAIYICAILLSLALCDRMNDLESREDYSKYHQSLSMNLS